MTTFTLPASAPTRTSSFVRGNVQFQRWSRRDSTVWCLRVLPASTVDPALLEPSTPVYLFFSEDGTDTMHSFNGGRIPTALSTQAEFEAFTTWWCSHPGNTVQESTAEAAASYDIVAREQAMTRNASMLVEADRIRARTSLRFVTSRPSTSSHTAEADAAEAPFEADMA